MTIGLEQKIRLDEQRKAYANTLKFLTEEIKKIDKKLGE